ncbi:CKLF-like MARVEL transmembrane domain-containing protein 6 [Bombina bombina]|uniref:CKLF-like MARVEL transmembrane domain-containing protein 6 n=1 Tax=Bombina bombina TaxID=8345 RepID=UPI00235B18B5|nr:CKLF-like MARVEL transmembrane domain-containing protein 6 [Bombina bombina]
MAEPAVYAQTTEPALTTTKPCCSIRGLGMKRLIFKVSQLVLSFVAFLCEELINECENCGGLYFFEFVSCSAFLLAVLILIVYCTPLHDKFKPLDLINPWVVLGTGLLFLIASIVFAATKDNITLASVSVAFGFLASFAFLFEFLLIFLERRSAKKEPNNMKPENEPLKTPTQVEGSPAETA